MGSKDGAATGGGRAIGAMVATVAPVVEREQGEAPRIGHNCSFGRPRQTEHFNKRFP